MARTYRPVDREQEFLLPPSMVDWLPEEHLVWFVIEAVNRLDTTAFHRLAKLGGVGRRGYDPDMLLTLFIYAMAHRESSSRRIERLCHTDVAFRIICAQDVPDHTVLARFRKNHEAALTDLLTESLVLAAELGMVLLGTVAFDGTKIAANASRDANRSEAHLRKLAEQFVATVAETDEAEDALFGEDNRGDEPPPEVADRTGRGERISQALVQIKARREAAARAEREQAERVRACERAVAEGAKGRGRYPQGTDRVAMAKLRWQRERAMAADRYESWHRAREQGEPRRAGRAPAPPDEHYRVRKACAAYQAEAAAASKATSDAGHGAADAADATGQQSSAGDCDQRSTANLTDPDSRLLKTRNGWIQGYNCQTATSDDEFIVSARATQDANDVEQFIPTMNDVTATAQTLADRTGRDDLQVGTMIGDAGYDSDDNLAAEGPDRLIADGKRHTIDQRAATDPATGDPPEHASHREKMNHRLRTPEGRALYKRRAPMVEAPNAWLKDGRGLRRFARRGLTAVQAELSFASAVTNLLKIATKGITATQLQTG
jgi:Transposase and inactivated derivatives